ncbi:hypothetical protein K488DRAFT_74165 [Vararia minispora EC-137]|uniref:Uncharacterized protein n=1 Tax=Vararia minispora EC-137 TaxID=1314806 RepID=A0ACB8Q8G6_9AGAM|nr:hypothetical protein K488DRAFT_74165 [Vararia minispora EC-137]
MDFAVTIGRDNPEEVHSNEDFDVLIDLLASDGIEETPDESLQLRGTDGRLDINKVKALLSPRSIDDSDQEDGSVFVAPPSDRIGDGTTSPVLLSPSVSHLGATSSRNRFGDHCDNALVPRARSESSLTARASIRHEFDEAAGSPSPEAKFDAGLPTVARGSYHARSSGGQPASDFVPGGLNARPTHDRVSLSATQVRMEDGRAAVELDALTALARHEISDLRGRMAEVQAMAVTLHSPPASPNPLVDPSARGDREHIPISSSNFTAGDSIGSLLYPPIPLLREGTTSDHGSTEPGTVEPRTAGSTAPVSINTPISSFSSHGPTSPSFFASSSTGVQLTGPRPRLQDLLPIADNRATAAAARALADLRSGSVEGTDDITTLALEFLRRVDEITWRQARTTGIAPWGPLPPVFSRANVDALLERVALWESIARGTEDTLRGW